VVVGRAAWKLFASDLGVVSAPVVPVGLITLAAFVAVAVGALAALGPAWFAARRRPGAPLRGTE
jgi:hypothetical protein